jgi:hypothetical protein
MQVIGSYWLCVENPEVQKNRNPAVDGDLMHHL